MPWEYCDARDCEEALSYPKGHMNTVRHVRIGEILQEIDERLKKLEERLTSTDEVTRDFLYRDVRVCALESVGEINAGDIGTVIAAWERKNVLVLWDKDKVRRSIHHKRLKKI